MKLFATKTTNGADAVLDRHEKLKAAITAGAKALPIDSVIEAREALAAVEVAAAIGETTEAAVTQASKRVVEVEKRLEEESAKLERIRTGLAALAAEVWSSRTETKESTIPQQSAKLREGIEREWRTANTQFQIAKARRTAVEALLGERLNLSEAPTPEAVGLTDAERAPWVALEQLDLILAELRAPERYEDQVRLYPSRDNFSYDEKGIYVLRREADGLPAKAKVIERSLTKNMLRALVNSKDATPYVSPSQQQAAEILWCAELARPEEERAAATRRANVQKVVGVRQ